MVGTKALRNESYLHSFSHLRTHNTPGSKYSRDWGYREEPDKSLTSGGTQRNRLTATKQVNIGYNVRE